jgi:hypothetical protein
MFEQKLRASARSFCFLVWYIYARGSLCYSIVG